MAWQSICSLRLEWRGKVETGREERRWIDEEEVVGVGDKKKVGGDKSIA